MDSSIDSVNFDNYTGLNFDEFDNNDNELSTSSKPFRVQSLFDYEQADSPYFSARKRHVETAEKPRLFSSPPTIGKHNLATNDLKSVNEIRKKLIKYFSAKLKITEIIFTSNSVSISKHFRSISIF